MLQIWYVHLHVSHYESFALPSRQYFSNLPLFYCILYCTSIKFLCFKDSLTHWLPGVPHWQVKLSGVRQSKILSLANFGRFGCRWVNGDIVFQWVIKVKVPHVWQVIYKEKQRFSLNWVSCQFEVLIMV